MITSISFKCSLIYFEKVQTEEETEKGKEVFISTHWVIPQMPIMASQERHVKFLQEWQGPKGLVHIALPFPGL